MQLGTCLMRLKELGFDKSLEMAAKAGFKFLDVDLTNANVPVDDKDEKNFFGAFKAKMDALGVKASQAHAPYVRGIKTDFEFFESEEYFKSVLSSIRRAEIIGAPYLVMHTFAPYPADYENIQFDREPIKEELFERNLAVLKRFEPYAERAGIKLAVENLNMHGFLSRSAVPTTGSDSADLNRYIDALGDKNYCVCYDVGHLNLLTSDTESNFINSLGKRIQVIHAHDNFGMLNDWFGELDRHLPPFVGCVNWELVIKELKKVGFDKTFSLELGNFYPTEFTEEFYDYAFKAGNKIINF